MAKDSKMKPADLKVKKELLEQKIMKNKRDLMRQRLMSLESGNIPTVVFEGNNKGSSSNAVEEKLVQEEAWEPSKHLNELAKVAGIELAFTDVGHALQFLEFCAVFGELLDIKKEDPEHVLEELLGEQKQENLCATVRLHIHLLLLIQNESADETAIEPDSWFNVLKDCFYTSQDVLLAHGLELSELGDEYETLNASEKLKLLILLCDEILQTMKVRESFMAKTITKVDVAQDKEESLETENKCDVADAVIETERGPKICSKGKKAMEANKFVSTNDKAKTSKPKKKDELSVVEIFETEIVVKPKDIMCERRAEPIFVDQGGDKFWKLIGYGASHVLCQSVRKEDTVEEKWFIMDDEGKKSLNKKICSLSRVKRQRGKH